MQNIQIEKYLGKNVAVVFDKNKINLSNTLYLSGELIDVSKNAITITMENCSYGKEVCIGLDTVMAVFLRN